MESESDGNEGYEVPAFTVEQDGIEERQFLLAHVFVEAADQQEIVRRA
jgi:hypothetical protein